jgi:uncharacterized protein YjbJ (UPF0337 family)
LFANTSFH